MSYLSTTVNLAVEEAAAAAEAALKRHGFDVLARIDMCRAFKRHVAIDFRPYLILTVYNPTLAYRAVQIDHKIGSAVLCNVVVQQQEDGRVEISVIDPAELMYIVNYAQLDCVIRALRCELQAAVEDIERQADVPRSPAHDPARRRPGPASSPQGSVVCS